MYKKHSLFVQKKLFYNYLHTNLVSGSQYLFARIVIRVCGNRLDKLGDPWFLLINRVFNNVNPVRERGDIALRCITQCPRHLFFFFSLSRFFTLQNLTSGWNSIAIRSLTVFSWFNSRIRDFSVEGEATRRRGIFVSRISWRNYYGFFFDDFVFSNCVFFFFLSWTVLLSSRFLKRFLKILKKYLVTLLLWIFFIE